jgi:hypothetical protein
MGMFRHMFRTLTKPYYVAVGETIGDYMYKLIPAAGHAKDSPESMGQLLKVFDTAVEVFARNSDRQTLKIAVEHWATRVGSPTAVASTGTLFSDPDWFQRCSIYLRSHHADAGQGFALFQQALKDAGVLSSLTFLEERHPEPDLRHQPSQPPSPPSTNMDDDLPF